MGAPRNRARSYSPFSPLPGKIIPWDRTFNGPGKMLSVAQAQTAILEQVEPLPPQSVRLGSAALGLVLCENVTSDADSPPFDKAMMDGYAVRAEDFSSGGADLEIVEEVTAGRVPTRTVGTGQATQIMTGAPIPAGANAVVMVERGQTQGGRVLLRELPRPGQNILPRGREMRAGEKILPAETVLRPQEIGILSGLGKALVSVRPRPRVTILSTGDEVVDIDRNPGPGQIRNSNGLMLLAQVQRAGGLPRSLLIVPDEKNQLRLAIRQGLEQGDVVVLSGGVSAGRLDLVPAVLAELGVKAHVHKVCMKPGKPVYFGTWTGGPAAPKCVFGLPGNPVSSLVCFELFVRPALRKLRGLVPGPCMVSACLQEDFPYQTDRPTYHPARLELATEGWSVRPVPWFGSADLRGVSAANAFLLLPEGDRAHPRGERYPVLRVEDDWM